MEKVKNLLVKTEELIEIIENSGFEGVHTEDCLKKLNQMKEDMSQHLQCIEDLMHYWDGNNLF